MPTTVVKTIRSSVLTLGAVLGVVSLLWTLGLALTGTRALVVVSGSMAPAISAGDVAFATSVPASSVEVGDVVSVTTAEGTRVTHRVVAATTTGATTTLQLRGDANNSADAQPYQVTSVDKVVGHLPKFGYVLLFASSRVGIAAGAGLLLACLWLGFFGRRDPEESSDEEADESHAVVRPETPSSPRHRRQTARILMAGVAGAVIVGAVIAPVNPTSAYFSDSPELSSPTDGVSAAPWFTCQQSMSNESYGGKPILHYNFNENTGAAQSGAASPYFGDDSGNGWDGIYFVGASASNVTPSVGHSQACQRDTASRSVYLAGGSDLATAQYVRNKSSLYLQNGPDGARWNTFTVNVWFKTNIQTGDDKAGVLAAFSQAGGIVAAATDRVLYLDNAGRVTSMVYPGSFKFMRTSGNYADNKWHMATMALGPAGHCLYVDARLVGCDATTTTAFQNTDPAWWRFGHAHLSNGYLGITDGSIAEQIYKGYLDEAAIYTRQLDQIEVRDLYRAGLPLRT